ncbi:MAG TPA: rhodanese-like domain-containing protein [Candidatus Xenobia bacterium]|jgi:rhodanese-related sulfurtransferase
MQQVKDITGKSTMAEVLDAYPSARRALFQRYHIGGCSSCGFQDDEPLEEVLKNHRVLDVEGTLQFLRESADMDQKLQLDVKSAAEQFKAGKARLIDVRHEFEYETAHVEGSELLTQGLMQDMMHNAPKDGTLLFLCHHGVRSLEAAAYFAGHGFSNAKSIAGGIDAWSSEVDSNIPRY